MTPLNFTVDDLLVRYSCKTDSELAELLDFDKSTISIWRSNGLPKGYQRFLNLESKIHLKRRKKRAAA